MKKLLGLFLAVFLIAACTNSKEAQEKVWVVEGRELNESLGELLENLDQNFVGYELIVRDFPLELVPLFKESLILTSGFTVDFQGKSNLGGSFHNLSYYSLADRNELYDFYKEMMEVWQEFDGYCFGYLEGHPFSVNVLEEDGGAAVDLMIGQKEGESDYFEEDPAGYFELPEVSERIQERYYNSLSVSELSASTIEDVSFKSSMDLEALVEFFDEHYGESRLVEASDEDPYYIYRWEEDGLVEEIYLSTFGFDNQYFFTVSRKKALDI